MPRPFNGELDACWKLVESLPVAAYAVDADGRLTHFNDAAVILWGRQPQLGIEFWCESWRMFRVDGTPLARDACPMAVAVREDRALRGEVVKAERPDGTTGVFEVYPTPIHDASGTLVGGMNIVVDISRRNAAEQALLTTAEIARRDAEKARELAENARRDAEDACAVAEHASRIKTSFMRAAGHDLRQPLQAMRLLHGILAGHLRSLGDEVGLQASTGIGQAISEAEELLNSLMDLATLEAGAVTVNLEDLQTTAVIDQNVGVFRVMAEKKGLELRIRSSATLIRSDPILLKRIIRNLVINAIKYTDHGGILVGCRRRGRSMRVDIWDTGVGIAEANLAKIFEEFYRGDEAADRGGGLGIGLSIVRRMAQLLGHEVTVRSREGSGSLFAVSVPLA